MDFELDDNERSLQEGMHAFLAGRCTMDVVRANEETGGTLDRGLWRELGEVGVFSLRADGFGMTESALVFEELGRALVPGPLVASHLTAHLAADVAADLAAGAADGSQIVGLVEDGEPPNLLEHAASIDRLIALRSDGVYVLDADDVGWSAIERPLDALTPVALIATLPTGTSIGGASDAQRWRRDGMVLTAALQLGLCRASIDLAKNYAMQREQFGRPIGSFQAVKHLLADMLTKAEVTRAAVYAAAVNIDGRGDSVDLMQTARMAKMLAGDSALFCGKTCIQVHGGMGFTWEVDAQRYWKRACVLDTHFGNSDEHAAAYAASL